MPIASGINANPLSSMRLGSMRSCGVYKPVMGTHDRASFLPQRPAGNRGKRQRRVRHAFHADDTALPEGSRSAVLHSSISPA